VSDEQALLRAIRDKPDEDMPRLMYADWLDENAEDAAQRARAEFIRLQIQIPLSSEGTLTISRARQGLGGRPGELLVVHGLTWSVWEYGGPPYAQQEVVWEWEWHRGFLWRLRCGAEDWLRCVDTILPLHPIRTVTLTDQPVVQRYRYPPEGISLWGRPFIDTPAEPLFPRAEVELLLAHYWPDIRFELP
jgi:uncharacterized protein (TIGR02996 family)